MGLREIREALRGHPHRNDVRLKGNPKGDSTLVLAGREIEIGRKDSIQQIRAKIAPSPRALARIDAAVATYTEQVQPIETPKNPSMSITGLKSGAFQDMLAQMRKEIAEAQNDGVAQVGAAKDQAKAEIQNTISGVKDKIKSEVSDALQEFSEFTNGGPA